jgi:hypothetical protein
MSVIIQNIENCKGGKFVENHMLRFWVLEFYTNTAASFTHQGKKLQVTVVLPG